MIPNIFSYATKELSQDAFICWLVACAGKADGILRKCGLAFVEALIRSGGGRVIDARSGAEVGYRGAGRVLSVVRGPFAQHGGIDVYFQANVDGNVVSFVVEDKTGTEMHSGQLERYRKAVGDDAEPEDLIKAVYFKTGYVFDDEREQAERAGYCVFDAKDVAAFFGQDGRSGTHGFVSDFAQHVGELVAKRRQALDQWNLDEGFVQWKFMVALGKELEEGDANWPARYYNLGGGAWTQYPHYERRRSVFWRLDSWKPLRLMVDTNEVGGDHALAAWDGWDQAFQDATQRSGLDPAAFRRVRIKSGAAVREGTIGAVDAGICLRREGLDRCVQKVADLHRRFINETSLVLA